MRLFPWLVLPLFGCAALLQERDRVTDFPVGDGRRAIVVEGEESETRSDLLVEFHHRAWQICPSGRYTFQTDMATDVSSQKDGAGEPLRRHTISGYVKCTPAEVTNASASRAAVQSSRVIERGDQQCIEGLDAEGAVVEESCAPLDR